MIKKAAAIIATCSSLLFTSHVIAANIPITEGEETVEQAVTTTMTPQEAAVKREIGRLNAERTIASKEASMQRKLGIQVSMLEQRIAKDASTAARIRVKIAEVREKIASREAEMRAKIALFKDKEKAEIADRVNTNLNKINKNHTDAMLKNLDNLSSILDKLENRIETGSPDIKDATISAKAAADARAKIDIAKTAVAAQAQKDYTITVTTESKIRLDAKAKRDELFKDLNAVRKLVIDARVGVGGAIKTAKSSSEENMRQKEGTNSGEQ